MKRRAFLQTVAAGSVSAAGFPCLTASDAVKADDEPFLLSRQGCGRATGYAESNKIVTLDGRTHAVWLDSPPEGFRARIRTLDRRRGAWSPTYTLGPAHDNHGGPALTVDSEGFLHVVYYPHHHAMRYRRSKRPNDASEWEDEIRFGERLTYPTLVCGPDDTLYLTARRSFSGRPWQVELWKRPPRGTWQRAGTILRSRYPGYAHFQESLAWGPDHRTLHLCCRFHEKTDRDAYGRLQTVGYLVSRDFGKSWQRRDGSTVSLPATAETAEVLASGGVDVGRVLRAGALAVDGSGRPHMIYAVEENGQAKTLVARPDGEGGWKRTVLNDFLPEDRSAWKLILPGGLTFDDQDNLIATAMLQRPDAEGASWGNPTNEVVQFRSPGAGQEFSFAMVSRPDPAVAHWLPNIERATGHNAVPSRPGILYTAGSPGEKNTELLSNKVFFRRAGD